MSFRLSVDTLTSAAKKSHYQPKVFVCVSTNGVDSVDQLLIHWYFHEHSLLRAKKKLSHVLCADVKEKGFLIFFKDLKFKEPQGDQVY